MTVITLGGLSGGGARTLGPIISQRLETDYVDRLILRDVAREVGATVEALHQREERPPTRGERFSRPLRKARKFRRQIDYDLDQKLEMESF